MSIEQWKDIPGYEGLYKVSDLGRVKSLNRINPYGRFVKGKILKLIRNGKYGHLMTHLCKNNRSKNYLVHRLVLLAFVGQCPKGMETRHLDGNPTNNHLINLKWGTAKENQQDSIRHGTKSNPPQRDNRGERNGQAKLIKKQILEIRKLYKTTKYTQESLAIKFNVTQQTIFDIISRRSWRHI